MSVNRNVGFPELSLFHAAKQLPPPTPQEVRGALFFGKIGAEIFSAYGHQTWQCYQTGSKLRFGYSPLENQYLRAE